MKAQTKPPRLPDKLLTRLIAPHLREEVMGDLHERYILRVKRLGENKARQHYWRDVLTYIRLSNIKRKPSEFPSTYSYSPIMLRNYLKIAYRNLVQNKLYSALNIAGLTFGLTCFFLIGLYVFDELTFDQQHSKADRIYRVIEHKKVKGEATAIAAAGFKLAEESRKTIAEIENTARMLRMGRANLVNPENPVNFQETVTVTNQNFLEIFDFPFLSGDAKTALVEPNTIIINEELAMRLFGKTDVIGKTLEYGFIKNTPLKITGVFKNHPHNSSFDFNNVLSDASFSSEFRQQQDINDWLSNNFTVYTLLKPNANPELVASKLKKMVLSHFTPELGTTFSFSLQPLIDLHLKSENILDGARNSNVEAIAQGNPMYIKIFSFIGLFVLLIAGINYMNLATARASNRSKEIGVRKSIGAVRSNLIYQFLFEALLIMVVSFLLAILMVNLLLPALNSFTNKQLSLGFSADYRIWIIALLASLLTGILSGSYPALLLSGFKPVLLLKGMKINNSGSLSLRKGLIVFQFTISTIMLVSTIVLFKQVQFLNNTDLGFKKELMVVIDVNTGKARENFEVIKAEMEKIPTVKSVSGTSRVPGEWKLYRTVKVKEQGSSNEPNVAYYFGADKDFIKTFHIQLLKGRNFENAQDSGNVIINETAAKMLNITEPSGQLVDIPSVSEGAAFYPLNTSFKPRVIGIVKDFNFQSLRAKIEPLVLAYIKNPIQVVDYYTAAIETKDIQGSLDKLKAVMVNADKNDPFEYHFLDEQLALFYIEDHRRQSLLIWLAVATIFIACLGLFGLATYTAEQRTKEIGVRKVLGASVSNLVTLLSIDFIKLVLIAISIAFPIAWYATKTWLLEYAYHIDLHWWMFALAGISAIAIALFTVSYQAIKAALMNPVKSLKTE